jgi:hypothetical protein
MGVDETLDGHKACPVSGLFLRYAPVLSRTFEPRPLSHLWAAIFTKWDSLVNVNLPVRESLVLNGSGAILRLPGQTILPPPTPFFARHLTNTGAMIYGNCLRIAYLNNEETSCPCV